MKKWISLCLVALLIFGVFAGCSQTEQSAQEAETEAIPASTVNAEGLTDAIKLLSERTVEDIATDDPRFDEIVATCGDYQLSNRVLQFYYWMAYLNFRSSMSSYGVSDMSMFGLDASKSLAEQQSLAEGMSWEQSFLSSALESFRQNAAVAMVAKADGFELPADVQEYLDTLDADLEEQAATYGYEDTLSFVQESFGPGATVESYREYVELFYNAAYYENEIYDSLEYTDEELAAYFEANAETFEAAGVTMDDTTLINVRHILITWEDEDGDGTPTDEEKAAALAEAERILALYEEDPTEEHFAALAEEYSTDPGSSSNGGLYEEVAPGTMVQPFNDWCFDESRNPGDTGIVETTYGYHIMYFVSQSATLYWKQYALNNGFLNEKMDKLVDEMVDQYDISVTPEAIVLGKADIYA